MIVLNYETILPFKFFSGSCTLGGKKDEQLTLDDSYMLQMGNLDIFYVSFCVSFL